MSEHAAIAATIEREAQVGDALVRGRQIEDDALAATVAAQRATFAELKRQIEDARDAEYLPLMMQAKAVLAKYGPAMARLKRADDVLRLAEKAWKKRCKAQERGKS